ncbi:hypothetical protein [Variovorax sp.]|uniref:hypothetical protein n=1 Tax=Variovorax sp. TaxID=1871043 RepID=UPI001383F44F|nr:hypothetical protein [Variovorax sp.]KAF1069079.1 MAG: hypothetical protein GAK39_02949 [Variovorax sp.]
MKQQISRLSPHQNGKVFGVMMAVTSLMFLVPFALLFALVQPAGKSGPSLLLLLLAPLMYLVFAYCAVAIGCLIYNFLQKFVGGIEFETSTPANSQ